MPAISKGVRAYDFVVSGGKTTLLYEDIIVRVFRIACARPDRPGDLVSVTCCC